MIPRIDNYPNTQDGWLQWARNLGVELERTPVKERIQWYEVNVSPGFQNSYVDGTDAVAFRRDGEENVWLRGVLSKTTPIVGEIVFTFPTGFRPAVALLLTTDSQDFSVDANGDLKYQGTGWSATANMAGLMFTAGGG